MNTKLFTVVILSSFFIISCGKKDDLQQTMKEDEPKVMPKIIKEVMPEVMPEVMKKDSSVEMINRTMTLTEEPETMTKAIDVDNVPIFDTGIRPGSSK